MKRIKLANIVIKMSEFELVLKGSGDIIELIHNIQNILKMFDQITFHIAISLCFFIAATAEVASSGSDVHIATTVNHMRD
jgi:hypothetical protein